MRATRPLHSSVVISQTCITGASGSAPGSNKMDPDRIQLEFSSSQSSHHLPRLSRNSWPTSRDTSTLHSIGILSRVHLSDSHCTRVPHASIPSTFATPPVLSSEIRRRLGELTLVFELSDKPYMYCLACLTCYLLALHFFADGANKLHLASVPVGSQNIAYRDSPLP